MWKLYFNLTKPSPLEANSQINGINLAVSRGSTQLTIENIDASRKAEAQQKALAAANLFLDTLSWKYGATFAIDRAAQRVEHARPTGQKQASITVGDGPINVSETVIRVMKDSSGNILEVSDSSKLGRINVKPSDAAKYYRHAHLTDDPFNRFHDLYLAAENIASKIQGLKGLSRSGLKQLSESGQSYEEGLLRLALDECFGSSQQSLKQTARNVSELDDAQEVTLQVAKILYTGYRCRLNHSKAWQDKKIPFNPEDEKEVKAALPLMEVVAKSFLQYEENSLLD